MDFPVDENHSIFYQKVGQELKRMRLENAELSVLAFSKKIGLSRKVYSKMEEGIIGDYYLYSLQRAISFYPRMTLSKFFKQAGL